MKKTSFKEFMKNDMEEEKGDISKTLNKIPPAHAALVKGYHWKFHPGNTLNGDDEHIGYIDDKDKVIAVAAPYNYGREFTVLHEIAHKVWDTLSPNLKNQWKHICANTKNKQNQDFVELFCQAYANTYVKNKIVIHNHPEWDRFIKSLSS